MSRPVARYRPSRRYYLLLAFAVTGLALSAWSALRFPAVWIAAAGFVVGVAAVLALVLRPTVEIHESHLQLGGRSIAWRDIRKVDRTGWNAPLVLRLAVSGGAGQENLVLIYPGDLDACTSLLRHLKRYSREALLDGVPYPEFWGEASAQSRGLPAAQLPPARYPVLRPEEEDEVERMFQRLKSAGSIDEDESISPHASSPHGSQRAPHRGLQHGGPLGSIAPHAPQSGPKHSGPEQREPQGPVEQHDPEEK